MKIKLLAMAKITLLTLGVLLLGCSEPVEPKVPSHVPNPSLTGQTETAPAESPGAPPAEIIFRAKFSKSKECRPGPGKSLALGLWDTYLVVEVLQGELKMKRLFGPRPPTGFSEGETQTVSWKPSLSALRDLRQAEMEGFTGFWLPSEEEFVLVPSMKAGP